MIKEEQNQNQKSNYIFQNDLKINNFWISFFLFSTFILLFENGILKLFRRTVLGDIYFSFQDGTWIATLLTIIFTVFIICRLFKLGKRLYQFSLRYYIIQGSIIIYYLSLRFFPSRLDFSIDFVKIPHTSIAYYDIILGSWLVATFLFCLIKRFTELKINNQEKLDSTTPTFHTGFSEEYPIERYSDDQQDYQDIARNLARLIYDNPNLKQAFTIGINGKWGIGKTSLLNLIELAINEKWNGKLKVPIVLKYSPLLVDNRSDITSDFLLLLNHEFDKYTSKSRYLFKAYILSLSNRITDVWSFLLYIFSGETSYKKQYRELIDVIHDLDRKVIVMIDDLDRLNRDEINNILRLVRNICNFPNIFFIVAYDKDYLCYKLNEKDEPDQNHSEKYLEKFFSVEVSLPEISGSILREEIKKEINNKIPDERIDTALKNIFRLYDQDSTLSFTNGERVIPTNFFDQCIATRRDLKRFINSLILIPRDVFPELNLEQLISLELLKLKHHRVFSSIMTRKILTRETNGNYEVYTQNMEEVSLLLKELKYNNGDRIFIERAISELLVFNSNNPDLKSLANVNRFELYFNHNTKSFLNIDELNQKRKSK